MPFADRAARTREAIRLMRTLWSEDTPSFAGRFHQVPPSGFSPKPVQQPGADHPRRRSPAALRRGGARRRLDRRRAYRASAPCWLREHLAAAGAPRVRDQRRHGARRTPRPRHHPRVRRAGVHRLFAFSPGFVPRGKLASDLYPAMERFAAEHIGA
jgi:alkanesulfonate monooxygenase SsuD/methylene tetrahydromethanopterin reductase-like flavin-dependent oxidoreductase (luciferase family)